MRVIDVGKPFSADERKVYELPEASLSLVDILDRCNPSRQPREVVLNGCVVPPCDLAVTRAYQHDRIILRVPVRGFLAPVWAAWASFAAAYPTAAAIIVNIAVAFIGGMIIKALTGKPSATDAGGPSPWASHTVSQESIPIPKFYGRNRLYGNIIASWRSTSEEEHYVPRNYSYLQGAEGEEDDPTRNSYAQRQKLNLIIGLGEGPVEGIVADSERINEQPISNFPNVICEEKTGTISQTAFTDLTELPLEYQCDILVTKADGAVTYTVPLSDMDAVEVGLTFPKGLVRMRKGKSLYNCVNARVELAERDSGSWNTLFDGWLIGKTLNPVYAYCRNTGSYNGGDPVDMSGWAGCDIRVTKVDTTTGNDGDNVIGNFDELYVSVVHAIYSTPPVFPKQAMIFIEAVPSEKISGNLKFDCLQDGAIVNTYDGSSWTLQYSDNPAWVILDLVTQPVITGGPGTYAIDRYLGLDPGNVDLDALWVLAQFCDEMITDGEEGTQKRFVFNGGFIQTSDVWRSLLSVCDGIRCAPVWDGQQLTFVIDKSATPLQLFSVGNILEDSFRLTYLPQDERASEIEVRYRDEATDYKSGVPIVVVDETREMLSNSVAVDLQFCTRQAEAWRYGRFKLLQNQLLLRSIEFAVDTDALICAVGDLFYFQHDRLDATTMIGGRVVSATANTITVNRNAELDGSLKVLVRVYNPTTGQWSFEDHTVSDVTDTVITISDTWTVTPRLDDPWIMGVSTAYDKTYRVTKLDFRADRTTLVSAIEYDADVYACDTDEPALQTTGSAEPKSATQHVQPALLPVIQDDGFGQKPADTTEISNVTWTSDDPGAGDISWAHTDAYYPIEVNYQGTLYPVDDGDTSDVYVYWYVGDPNVLNSTDDLADVVANSGTVLQVNDGGTTTAVLDQYNLTSSYVNQDVTTTASPTFVNEILTGYLDIAERALIGDPEDKHQLDGAITLRVSSGANEGYGHVLSPAGIGITANAYNDGTHWRRYEAGEAMFLSVLKDKAYLLHGATGNEDAVISLSYLLRIDNTGALRSYSTVRADGGFYDGATAGIDNSAAGVPTALTISGGIVSAVTKNDWLDQSVKQTASPTFVGGTLSGAAASRLLSTDGDKALTSVADLSAWVAGTASQIAVANDGDGSITLSLTGNMDEIAALAVTDGNIVVGNGATWVAESGATARTSLGLGTGDSPQFAKLLITSASAIVNTEFCRFSTGKTGFNGSNDSGIIHSLLFDGCAYSAGTKVVQRDSAKIAIQKEATWNEANAGPGINASMILSVQTGTITTPVWQEGIRIKSDGCVGMGGVANPSEDVHAADTIRADTAFNLNGTDGITTTFLDQDGNTITVSGGIITAKTAP